MDVGFFVPYEIDFASMLCYTQRMILHSGASTDVSQDDYLH